ncbi:endospore germination permease [Bacillus sinesaloumensis]|uniref:endospore germination permease n=1 Tax=Litchfieldia sinesaloumensis TaxID=1926280 RepID=UPI0009884ED7|nr:endospore germination permease [Bacillus sinesaloumensis]
MNGKLISAVHIYVLLIMSTGFMVHVLIIPVLLTTSNRDSWLSVIFSAVPFIIWILLLFYLYKKGTKHEDILSLLHKKCKYKAFRFLLKVILGAYFLLVALITLKFTYIWAKGNYALETPDFVIIIMFAVVCYFATSKGLLAICTISLLSLPIVSIFGFIVGIGNTPNKNYELLFPIFENGYSEFFKGILYSCSGLFDIIFLLFLTPYIKNKLKAKWLLVTGIMLILLILGPLTGAISEFGPHEAAKMRNPAYEEWRLLKLGEHMTRLDFLSIFQWLSGSFVRISLSMFIVNRLFTYRKRSAWVLPTFYSFVIIGVYIPWDAHSFFLFLKNYYFPISLGVEIGIFLLFLLLIRSAGEQHGETTNEQG